MSNTALAIDFQHIETRYGKVDAINQSEKVSIHYQDKVILKAEADGASLFRITSDAGNEYVIVNFSHGGLNCHGFFQLIEISSSGTVKISQEFGECYELGGAGFIEANPVVHLKQAVDGSPVEMASFLWKGNTVNKIFESTDSCRSLGFSATTVSMNVKADMGRQVAGVGRLQFYSAPSDTCAISGVFVLPGERLTSLLKLEDFIYVRYTNPKTAKQAEGWVHADRLSPVEK